MSIVAPIEPSIGSEEMKWSNPSEQLFFRWLQKEGFVVIYEPGWYQVPGTQSRTIPDYFLPECGVLIELTVSSKSGLLRLLRRSRSFDERKKARRCLQRLLEKQERARQFHAHTVPYLLVDGDLYRGIMKGKRSKIRRFYKLLERETCRGEQARGSVTLPKLLPLERAAAH